MWTWIQFLAMWTGFFTILAIIFWVLWAGIMTIREMREDKKLEKKFHEAINRQFEEFEKEQVGRE